VTHTTRVAWIKEADADSLGTVTASPKNLLRVFRNRASTYLLVKRLGNKRQQTQVPNAVSKCLQHNMADKTKPTIRHQLGTTLRQTQNGQL